MRFLLLALFIGLVALQYRLWLGDGGVIERKALREELSQQEERYQQQFQTNEELRLLVEARNQDDSFAAEEAEARARSDLGYIQEGETFFWIRESEEDTP